MTVQFLPDARIEAKAIHLLNRYESEYGKVSGPPIPVEEIADNLLELGILWGSVSEAVGTTTLAGLEPDERMIKFNESRRQVFEETPGLYNTVLGHEIGHWVLHVDHNLGAQQHLPNLDQRYECLYQESTCTKGPKETQAHRFMGFLLMPSTFLWEAVRDIELTRWPNLYRLRDLFEVTISTLTIRLEQLGVLYVSEDRQLYPSKQEYQGQTRMAL